MYIDPSTPILDPWHRYTLGQVPLYRGTLGAKAFVCTNLCTAERSGLSFHESHSRSSHTFADGNDWGDGHRVDSDFTGTHPSKGPFFKGLVGCVPAAAGNLNPRLATADLSGGRGANDVPQGQHDFLPYEMVEKALCEFRAANGLSVHLMGGEAMHHPGTCTLAGVVREVYGTI